jgi:predicted DNA-binding transcriptional regulator AlpA
LSDESLITGKRLRKLLGDCSEMHVWRLLNNEKYQVLAFPKPIKINDRNYWRLGAIRQWICEREAQSQATSTASLPAVLRSKPNAVPQNVDPSKQKNRPIKEAPRRTRGR